MKWTVEDERIHRTLEDVLGPVTLLAVEERERESALTDQTAHDDGIDWGELAAQAPGVIDPGPAVVHAEAYPEYPDNPANHRYTVSIDNRGPMIVCRGNTAAEINAAYNELEAYGVWDTLRTAYAKVTALKNGPAAPAPAPAAAPQSAWQTQGPPQQPNVPYPGQPAWQTAGAGGVAPYGQPQPAQQYGQQQQGGYNSNTKPEPAPNPGGWPKANGRSGPGFDAWKAFREANKDALKGKVKWAGNADYWISPDVAQWIASLGFAVQ